MNKPKMSADQFEAQYAYLSGVTVEWLHQMGKYAFPCSCDYEHCVGCQMAVPGSLTEHEVDSWPEDYQNKYRSLIVQRKTDRVPGLLLLWSVDGLPPIITVHSVAVKLDEEGKLTVDKEIQDRRGQGEIPDKNLIEGVTQEDDIDLQEYAFEGRRYLAGFSEKMQILVIGTLNRLPPVDPTAQEA